MRKTPRDEAITAPYQGATALYRFFNEAGDLLYVGITVNTTTRWNYHRYFAAGTWWPTAVEKTVQWFGSREDAARGEIQAIRHESPLWNSAAAPLSNPRLANRRFTATTGGMNTVEWGWRNADMAVYHVLAGDIAEGAPAVGEPLPPLASICSTFGVSYRVARSAVQLLVEDGYAQVETERQSRRFLVVSAQPNYDWRPPPLPDGRDALESLLHELRTSPADLSAIARTLGLHISIVRGWQQRHTRIAEMIEEAMVEGRRNRLYHKLTAGRGKRTDLNTAEAQA